MSKPDNVPSHIDLDPLEVLFFAITCSLLDCFPSNLHENARFSRRALDDAVAYKRISYKDLLAAAYFGIMPIWSSFENFTKTIEKLNRLAEHEKVDEFRKDRQARERSAVAENNLEHGEIKRLYPALDRTASEHGFNSFEEIFACNDDVSADQSPYSPLNREPYVMGPRYLWDFAKTTNAQGSGDFVIESSGYWLLVLHLDDGLVHGYALPPFAMRTGNCDSSIMLNRRRVEVLWATDEPIFDVPDEIVTAITELAEERFPHHPFEYFSPPTVSDAELKTSRLQATAAREAYA